MSVPVASRPENESPLHITMIVTSVLLYACPTAQRAIELGTVCTQWWNTMLSSGDLWIGFSQRRWGAEEERRVRGTAPSVGGFRGATLPPKMTRRVPQLTTMNAYRHRVLMERRYAPLHKFQLHSIEGCHWDEARTDIEDDARLTFRCPQLAEALTPSGELDERGRPLLHCSVCQKHVYTVMSVEELNFCAKNDRCVQFFLEDLGNVADLMKPGTRSQLVRYNQVYVVVADGDPTLTQARRLLSQLRCIAVSSGESWELAVAVGQEGLMRMTLHNSEVWFYPLYVAALSPSQRGGLLAGAKQLWQSLTAAAPPPPPPSTSGSAFVESSQRPGPGISPTVTGFPMLPRGAQFSVGILADPSIDEKDVRATKLAELSNPAMAFHRWDHSDDTDRTVSWLVSLFGRRTAGVRGSVMPPPFPYRIKEILDKQAASSECE